MQNNKIPHVQKTLIKKDPSPKKKFSLIVAMYKKIDFIDLVLTSINRQSYRDFEVIIAEDDNCDSVRQFLEQKKKDLSFTMHHISQVDDGFRKNTILNSAIRMATGEHLIFIDGDCILHPRFLFEYARRIRSNTCLFGRRVRLDPKTTQWLLETKKIERLSPFHLLMTRSKRVEDGLYLPFIGASSRRNILGCNFCISKKDMERINGFDEDFTSPLYGEDADVKRRLKLAGVHFKSTRFKTIQYHLYHSTKNRKQAWEVSGALYEQKKSEGLIFCKNGLIKMAEPSTATAGNSPKQ